MGLSTVTAELFSFTVNCYWDLMLCFVVHERGEQMRDANFLFPAQSVRYSFAYLGKKKRQIKALIFISAVMYFIPG